MIPAQWSWQLLRAGSFRLDGGSMFGIVPRILWSALTTPDDRNRIHLQTNCLLLDDGLHKALIETGYGDKWSKKDRDIFCMERRTIADALGEIGIAPEDIDLALITHLHFDHAGGLTHTDDSGEAISTFPSADIIVQQIEWDDALACRSTMTKTYLRDHLDPVAGQVRAVQGEVELLPGLFVWPVIGHTWGHQAVRFFDDKGVVCFPGDLIPTIHHQGIAFNMAYDMLPHANMLSKQSLLERALAEKWRIVIDHEVDHPVVSVVRDPKRSGGVRLEPIE